MNFITSQHTLPQTMRDAFWAIDANNDKYLAAITLGKHATAVHEIVFFSEKDFSEDEFHAFKNRIFDEWKNGNPLTWITPNKTVKWDMEKNADYPADAPVPEKEEKKESLLHKGKKYILATLSKKNLDEMIDGLTAFSQKVMGLTAWNREDYEFAKKYEDAVRALVDKYRDNEQNNRFAAECLSPADAHNIRSILRDVMTHLDSLKSKLSEVNYERLKTEIDKAEELAQSSVQWKETREALVAIKNDLRDSEVLRVQKDELWTKINRALDILSQRQNAEKNAYEQEAIVNHAHYKSLLEEMQTPVNETTNFQPVRDQLKKIQVELRESKLTRDQRNELFDGIDVLFKTLGERQSLERESFLAESSEHFTAITERLEVGKKLAQFDEDFNVTRGYLIELQKDLGAARLSREQREALRTQLNEAFATVNKRADKFYADRRFQNEKRTKEMEDLRLQKRQEWEFRMKEKIIRLEKIATGLDKSIEADNNYVSSMQEKYEDTGEERFLKSIENSQKQLAEKQARVEDIRKEVAEIEEKLRTAN